MSTATLVKSLQKLHEGDPVLFYPHSYAAKPIKAKVERVTKNRVIVKGVAFDKRKGYACGHGQDALPPAIEVDPAVFNGRPTSELVDRPMKRKHVPTITPEMLKALAKLAREQEKKGR